jgi:hypothetical protein
MNVYVYESAFDKEYDNIYGLDDNDLMINNDFSKIMLIENIWHIAKSKELNSDIYQDALTKIFNGDIFSETWMRPKREDTENVDNIEIIKWYDGTFYSDSQDHSKYAFSKNPQSPFVFIGDMNNMFSQRKRGGGGIIIKDYRLWNSFFSLIYKS